MNKRKPEVQMNEKIDGSQKRGDWNLKRTLSTTSNVYRLAPAILQHDRS